MCLATTACLKDAPLSSRSRLHISSKSFSRVVSTLTTKDIQALLSQWVYVADIERIFHSDHVCSLFVQLRIGLSETDRKFHLQSQAQCRGIRTQTRHDRERFQEVLGKKHRMGKINVIHSVRHFQGSLVVRVQEFEGSFSQTILLEDSVTKYELNCHSKGRR